MASLTAANALIFIGVTGIFAIPQQLQGFAADDIFSTEAIDNAELVMGADAKLSAGWVPMMVPQEFTLQADSASNGFFESWYTTEQAAQEKFPAFANVTLPSIGRSYVCAKGFLSNYKPMADAKKILQPRKFRISWETVLPVPLG